MYHRVKPFLVQKNKNAFSLVSCSKSHKSHVEDWTGWNDTRPQFTKKVYPPNPNKKRVELFNNKILPKAPGFEVRRTTGPRSNAFNIQMLSKNIYEHIFCSDKAADLDKNNKTSPSLIADCKSILEKHQMLSKTEDYLPDVDLKMPPLLGNNIEDHFRNIAEEQVKPYQDLIQSLLTDVPEKPKTWIFQKGWTRYVPGNPPEPVSYPSEEALIFDIEVCLDAGKAPTLATAVSPKAWYAWISQSLIDGTSDRVKLPHEKSNSQYSSDSLIPLESAEDETGNKLTERMKKPKIVVGHNVSYDRARIKEQYWLEGTATRFLDTMSIHVCVSGLTSYQRAVLKSDSKNSVIDEEYDEEDAWKNLSSLNNLADVHKLYCGTEISKKTRDIFVEGTLNDIKREFQQVMDYCAGDVLATHRVLRKMFPMFSDRFPHPVSLAGMLEMSVAYLPVNSKWNWYIENSEQTYRDLEWESKFYLVRKANQACQLLVDDKYKDDIWLWDLDWTVKPPKFTRENKIPKRVETPDSKQSEETAADDVKTVETRQEKSVESDEKCKTLSDEFENLDREIDRHYKEKFAYLFENKSSKKQPFMSGYPEWYRKLCPKPGSTPDWKPGPHLITTGMRITPKLLNLTWEGYPLHYVSGKGWGFLVPFTEDVKMERKFPLKTLLKKCPVLSGKPTEGPSTDAMSNISNLVQDDLMKKQYYAKIKSQQGANGDPAYKGAGVWCDIIIQDCCYFYKLPHKDGPSKNVGNPLSKDFISKFSENVLGGDTETAEQVMTIARKCSYWRNNRDRILNQMVVWLNQKDLPKGLAKEAASDSPDTKYGAILPQVVVCGTLTRRAVEPTWMTASNAHPERVGSELRAMVQAPPGYSMVGADVDSQELWIASVIGDAYHAKIHGATPLGWMTLSGNKSDGTDMHSVTAKAVGISRDHAKVINYARIYGAGQNFAERLLKQFNPSISEAEARSKATKMFAMTKGKKIYFLKQEHLLEFPDQPYSRWQAMNIAKICGKTVDEMFLKSKWVGGTESAMFNSLETIATCADPRTPFLKCKLSRALDSSDDKYLPTKINWVVQSGAVDFLHLMLVCMRWLMRDKARFCLSFHDEIRYLVPDKHKYQAALAMHVTNLLTRSFCSVALGIEDLPQSVAFFSSVEVDKALRKDAKQDYRTPSNPDGLETCYGIPHGESLNVYEAVEKARGRYSWWYEQLRK